MTQGACCGVDGRRGGIGGKWEQSDWRTMDHNRGERGYSSTRHDWHAADTVLDARVPHTPQDTADVPTASVPQRPQDAADVPVATVLRNRIPQQDVADVPNNSSEDESR